MYATETSTTTVVELTPAGTPYGALTIDLQPRDKSGAQQLFDDYMHALDVQPLRTKTLTVAGVTALSAVLASLLKDTNPLHLNVRLILALVTIAVTINAPPYHFLYDFLEDILPTRRKINVAFHLAVDQLVASPVYIFCYILVKSFLLGTLTVTSFLADLDAQFWPILKLMWFVYPVTQTFNFAVVPPKFRVLFSTLVSFFVNAVMAYCFSASSDPHSKISQMIRLPFA